MNCLNVLIVLVSALMVVTSAGSIIEKYKAECEKVADIEPFLKNEKLVTTHVKCLLGETKCNNDGEKIKSAVIEVIQNTCSTCTEKQKDIVRTVMRFMLTNRPSDFHKIFEKYDPDNKYKPQMIDFMNKSS